MSHYAPIQFALFRILLGSFLCVFFLRLLPWAGEIFGPEGLFPTWIAHAIPNPFSLWDSARFARAFVAGLAVCAALFAAGVLRRSAAVVLWYGLVSLVVRSAGSIENPSMAFLGWLLLASALVPLGEGLALRRREADPAWHMPRALFVGAWAMMAVGYSASGWDKLASSGWLDGSALHSILGLAWARDCFLRDLLLALPAPVLKLATWLALGTELLFLPLCLLRITRIAAWCAGLALHLTLLVLLDFPDISAGMLFIHGFTFDASWLARSSRAS